MHRIAESDAFSEKFGSLRCYDLRRMEKQMAGK